MMEEVEQVEETGGDAGEEAPPLTKESNGDCDQRQTETNNDVTSCPAEVTPDETPDATAEVTMETEESEEVPETPEKPGSGPVVVQGTKSDGKLQKVRKWSITRFKCTKQALSEKLGRGSRTVDLDLERRLQLLEDDRHRYDNVAKLAQTLANQIAQFTVTQKTLGDAFAELSVKSQTLHAEFGVNAEAQRFVSRSNEELATSISSFSSDMNTLVQKSIEDTMITARRYEATRIEYDAYRVELEELNLGPRDASTLPRLEQATEDFRGLKERYQRIRDDLTVKVRLLEENRVKVLHQQLWLLHSALAGHSLSCHSFLQQNWAEGEHLSPVSPVDTLSWLEQS